MLYLWLLAGLVHGCLSGGLYPTSAGSSVEAHGPLARLALHHGVTHVTSYNHEPSVAHVYAAHSPHVAPVYQVPTVAQVPILKYTTQPRYVQRLVDVTNAQVAVAKLQVRRPAIQKQFYDIEERTIVRPVGSAVLELDEPVSKQFVSPFSVVPAGHHSISQFHRPLLYPVGSYPLVSYGPLQVPVQHYPASIQPPQQYPIISQHPQQFPSIPQPPQQYPITSQPPQQFPPISQPPQQYPASSQPPQQVPTIPQLPQEPANTEPQPPQQFPFESQPSPDDSFNTEFDSSDSVVVENPDFTRSSKSNDDESKSDNNNEDSFDEFEKEVSNDQNENTQKNTEQDRVVQNIISDFENLQLLRMFSSQTGNEKPLQRSQQRPNFRVLLEPPKILEQPQQTQLKPSDEIPSFQRSKETGLGDSLTQTDNSIETSSHRASSSTTERELPTLYRSYLNHLRDDQIAASKVHSTDEFISSARHLSPDQSQENQRKLLELLTGRGEVSEVALARSGGESAVRGRVVSVTPAAPCAEGEERVNTRRIVVSRPVHTVEVVDVQRPFTQVERVAVHEPVPVHTHHIATLYH